MTKDEIDAWVATAPDRQVRAIANAALRAKAQWQPRIFRQFAEIAALWEVVGENVPINPVVAADFARAATVELLVLCAMWRQARHAALAK